MGSSACGVVCRALFLRFLPLLVLAVAVFIGWVASTEVPEATFFATVFPLFGGYLPATIFGKFRTPGTPEVPADLVPAPRPTGEIFLQLPGGGKMPANGIGMCCRPTAYDPETVRRTVLWYLLLGGRHIDDADAYWNHRSVGQAIREAIALGIPRSEIFLTTKLLPSFYGKNTTATAVRRWLNELGLEHIDLALMHVPSHPLGRFGECKGKSWKACREETWQALSGLRSQGLIREIGVSNFNVKHMEEIRAMKLAPIAASQFQFNPWSPDWLQDVFSFCVKHGIVATAYGSLGSFLQKTRANTVTTLMGIASAHKKSVSQVLLRWALQKGASVIPGTANPNHMRENIEVYSFELSAAEMSSIDSLNADPSAKDFFFMPEDTT